MAIDLILELLSMRDCEQVPAEREHFEEKRKTLVPYTEGGGLSKQTLLRPIYRSQLLWKIHWQ